MNCAGRFNGKCKCGARASVVIVGFARMAIDFDRFRAHESRANGLNGKPDLGRVESVALCRDENGRLWRDESGRIFCRCDACGGAFYMSRVIGRYVSHVKCDARCESAIGHTCECACGGKNHGAAHGVAG